MEIRPLIGKEAFAHSSMLTMCTLCAILNSMNYEWDESKNISNRKDHDGVSFEEARTVWADPLLKELYDTDHSTTEERFIAIGHSEKSRILMVVFCERSADTIRIISARKATSKEIKDYEEL